MDSNIRAIAELYGYELVKKEDKKMIATTKTGANYEGNRVDLMAELTYIMNLFIKDGVASVDDLHYAVSMAAMSDDQIREKALDAAEQMLKELRKAGGHA